MDQKTKEFIDSEINNNEVCLFMKGTPDAPQCGFSMAVSNILKILAPILCRPLKKIIFFATGLYPAKLKLAEISFAILAFIVS